jgi:hypothetical protein
MARLVRIGVESGDDLALLSPADLEAPALPDELGDRLDRDFPRTVRVGDAVYDAEYDLASRQVTLRLVSGTRRDPPPLAYLPRFPGLRIVAESGRVLRERG